MGKKERLREDKALNKEIGTTTKVIQYVIFLIMGLIPLIVHVKSLEFVSPKIDFILYPQTKTVFEMFTYYKFVLLIIFCLVLLASFIYKIFLTNQPSNTKIINALLIIYSFTLLLSSQFSEFKTISLFGEPNRHMGVIAYLCFALIMFVIVNTPDLLKTAHYSFYVLMPLVAINAFLVLLDFLHINILQIDVINWLIMESYEVEGLRGTLNHPNYVSGMGAVLFAFFATAFIFRAKNQKERGLHLVMTACSSIIIYGSESLSGVVTFIFILVLLAGVIAVNKDKKKLVDLGEILLTSIIVFFLMAIFDSSFAKELISDPMLISLALASGIVLAIVYTVLMLSRKYPKKAFILLAILIVLSISFSFLIGGKIESRLEREFARIDSTLLQQQLKKDEFDLPEYGVAWGSGRLYLWKETVELCLQKPVLGYGLDTLSYTFNQGDPAKITALENERINVNKPHNIFLYMWYGGGFLTLFGYIAVIGLVLFRVMKFLVNKENNASLLWPFMFGILAYLYQGMFNDSIQGFESLLWIFMGFAYIISNNINTQENS